jgi:hypothetical protein
VEGVLIQDENAEIGKIRAREPLHRPSFLFAEKFDKHLVDTAEQNGQK